MVDMHISFCVNDKYVKYAGVFMTNIILVHQQELNPSEYKLNFHLFYSGIFIQDKEKLKKFPELYNVNLFLYDVSKFLNNLKIEAKDLKKNFSKEVFLCVCVPNLLPSFLKIEKILILDVDMLCLHNLKYLGEINLENYSIGACLDVEGLRKLKLIKKNKYLNTGLLLINIEKYIKQNLMQKCLDNYYENKGIYPEQDALNVVLNGNFKIIDKKFNFMRVFENRLHKKILKELKYNYYFNNEDGGNEKTVILHFINILKPGNKGGNKKIFKIYKKYVDLSLGDWKTNIYVSPKIKYYRHYFTNEFKKVLKKYLAVKK